MDDAEKELQVPFTPTKVSEASIRLKRLEDQKKDVDDKFDKVVQKGEGVIVGIQKIVSSSLYFYLPPNFV